ncbi:MAG TPA: hypothetical protein VL126_15045 [Bacteroidota bacterium]|nr:hypothetical protein [Bacteroidota bacterium]
MGDAKFIDHSGKKILLIDIAHCELEDVVRVVKEGKVLIATQTAGTILTLTNVDGTQVTSSVRKVLMEFVGQNGAFVKAGAVVGLDRTRALEFMAIVKFTGRNLKAFNDLEKAKEWLVAQPQA